MRRQNCGRATAAIVALAVMTGAGARPGAARGVTARDWVGSWATSQMIPGDRDALPSADLEDATIRQMMRLSIGGRQVRVLISNAFGTAPLRVDAVHIARAAGNTGGRINPASDRTLTFDGAGDVTVPAGASYWSDPVAFAAQPLTVVAVTMRLPHAPAGQTGHPGAHTTSYLVHGSHLADVALVDAKTFEHWYQLAGIAVDAAPEARAVVTFGDSITDGHGSTTDVNDRWPDRLAERLHAAPSTRDVAVLNHGIGGNRLLNEGAGPSALARFDRDVLAQPGARYVIVLEGINDLGTLTRDAPASPAQHDALVARMKGVFSQMVARGHAAGLRVYGATIVPDGTAAYYHPDAQDEAARQAVNTWIRTSGTFDGVIDFDAVTRDPADARKMKKAYDSGDGLHPSPAGYAAMAAAIPLGLFK